MKNIKLFLSSILCWCLIVFSGLSYSGDQLKDPYKTWHGVINGSETGWSEEEVARARYYLAVEAAWVSGLTDKSNKAIANIEKCHEAVGIALDVFSFSISLKAFKDGSFLKGGYAKRVKYLLDNASKDAKYVAKMAKYQSLLKARDRESLLNALTIASFMVSQAKSNGLGDSSYGDPFDLLEPDNTQDQKAAMDYLFSDEKSSLILSVIGKIVLDTASELPGQAVVLSSLTGSWLTRLKPPTPEYLTIATVGILNDVFWSFKLGDVQSTNKSTLFAFEFLRHYYMSFKGDNYAFQSALGLGASQPVSLKTMLWAFSKARTEGRSGTLAQWYGDQDFLDYFFGNAADLTNAETIIQAVLKTRPELGVRLNLLPALQYGSNSHYSTSTTLKARLEYDAYLTVNSPLTSVANVNVNGVTNTPHLAGNSIDFTFNRPGDFDVSIGLFIGGDIQQLVFRGSIQADGNYFDVTSPVLYSATSSGMHTLGVTFTSPRISELFKGNNGEIINAKLKLIRYKVEEEIAPGQWKNIQESDFFDSSFSLQEVLQTNVGIRFKDDAFFIARTGSHNFRLRLEMNNSDYYHEGTDHTLTWTSPTLTVRAQDVVWGWNYEPTRVYVDDTSGAAFDSELRTINLVQDQIFKICTGPVTPPSEWGSNYTVKLQIKDAQLKAQVLTSLSWNAQTGCAEFKATAGGRYKLDGLYAEHRDAQDKRLTHILDQFGVDYVQVVGTDPNAATAPASIGLVGYWNFDACDATDASGNALHGAIAGSPQCVDGKRGKALRLNGASDWVSVADSGKFPQSALTVAYWINREGQTLTGLENYVSKEQAFQSYLQQDGQFQSGLWKGTAGNWSAYSPGAGHTASLNGWVFYAFTFDNATGLAKTYINGALVNTTQETDGSATVRTSAEPLYLGRNGSANLYHVKGLLDEVRLYDKALTDAEVSALYVDGRGSEVNNLEVIAWGATNYRSSDFTNATFKAIATGEMHSLALKEDGTVVTWGDNQYGRATMPTGLRGVKAITAGVWHSLALKEDGTVVGWGLDNVGQVKVPIGLVGVIAISAGAYHSIALKEDGLVVAWGHSYLGITSVPLELNHVKAISAGGDHSLALKEDGTVVAWGANDKGQSNVPIGLAGVKAISAGNKFSLALKQDGTVVAWGNNENGQLNVPGGLVDVASISAGHNHALALRNDGSVAAWGAGNNNNGGQLNVPISLWAVKSIAAGPYHSLALKHDGTLAAWGAGGDGPLVGPPADLGDLIDIQAKSNHVLALRENGTVVEWGNTSSGEASVPDGLAGVSSIAAGYNHSFALKQNGTAVSWGGNSQMNVPAGLTNLKAIAASNNYVLALIKDGTVVAWGGWGANVPAGFTGLKAIAAGQQHFIGLKEDGTVVASGSNEYGETNIPQGLANVKAIAAGFDHSLALKEDGTVVAWGKNNNGETNVPVGLTGVIAIAAGYEHSLALKEDGTVVTWGDGYSTSNFPTGLISVRAIAAGTKHSLALGIIHRTPVVGAAFLSENLPDHTYQVGAATKRWRFRAGAVALTGLKAVRVSADANLGITVSEVSLGNVAANAEFVVELPVNPSHTAPAIATSVWKLVDGAGKAVTISNSKSNTFWLKLRTNRVPTFSPLQLSAAGGKVGASISLKLLGQDADGDGLSYSVVSGDGGMAGDTYVETPTAAGVKSVTLRVSDAMESSEKIFDIVVADGGGLSRFFADIGADSNPNGVYAATTFLASKGIVLGCGALQSGQRIFCVNHPVTQAEALKMLLLAAQERGFVTLEPITAEVGENMPNLFVYDETAGVFSNNSWAASYALTAAKLGMIDDAATWDPAKPVTRVELARWLDRLLDLNVPTALLVAQNKTAIYQFTDAASFADAEAYSQALHSAFFGYLGSLGGSFGPATVMERGDFAVVAAKLLRTPTLTGLTYGGTTEAVRFGQTMPVITHGRTLSITGVRGLDIKEILIAGDKVLEEWIDRRESFIRIGLALSDGQSLGPIRYVNELAGSPYTLDTSTLDIRADSLITLVVLLESRAPVGADMLRSNVIKAYFLPVAVDFPDRDKDGVRDDLDMWPDDARFTVDANLNGIPDSLEDVLAAMGVDGSQPATVAGKPATYTQYQAIMNGSPNDLMGNFASRMLRVFKSGKGGVRLAASAGDCGVLCSGVVANRPAGNALSRRSISRNVQKVFGAGRDGSIRTSSGIDCGNNCRVSYLYGTTVQITATPASGQVFRGWAGACSGAGICEVSLDADKVVSAVFAAAPAIPAVPAQPSASDGSSANAVAVNWQPAARATSYQLYRCQDATTALCGSALAEAASLSHTDTFVEAGTAYYYRVKACNEGGCSSFSSADTGWSRFGAVGSLTASRDQFKQIRLDWAAPSNLGGAAPVYLVLRADAEGGAPVLLNGASLGTSLTYLDTTAVNGKTYWYWVMACAGGGVRCGEMSTVVSGVARSQGFAIEAGRQFSPLLADVSAAYVGKELNLPVVEEVVGGVRFGFKVYTPDSAATPNALFRHATTTKNLIKPICPGGMPRYDESESWRFLNQGQFLVAGVRYTLNCAMNAPIEQSYIYIGDASVSGGAASLLNLPGKLRGLSLTDDHNQAGSAKDLMITLQDTVTGRLDVYLYDFQMGGVYSSNTSFSTID